MGDGVGDPASPQKHFSAAIGTVSPDKMMFIAACELATNDRPEPLEVCYISELGNKNHKLRHGHHWKPRHPSTRLLGEVL